MKRHTLLAASLRLALLAMVFSAGCSVDIPICQYPVFWQDGEIRSIIVPAFTNTSAYDDDAGNTMADRLAAALCANGTYEHVYDRWDAREARVDQDTSGWFKDAKSNRTNRNVDLNEIDAILAGTVSSFDACSEVDPRGEPIYAEDAHGNSYIAGYQAFTHNEAIISTTAILTDARTGEVIHASQPIQSQVISEGSPPEHNMDTCLAIALNEVTDQLVREFAIVYTTISVNKGDTLKITTGEYYDGKWQEQDKFTPADTEMTVVVNLPPEADRNTFFVAVSRKDGHTNLAGQEFVWRYNSPAQGQAFVFDLTDIAAQGGGVGEYEVKFYAGDQPLIEKGFKIEEPKE